MKQKAWIIVLTAAVVIVGGGAFLGGVKYNNSKGQRAMRNFSAGGPQMKGEGLDRGGARKGLVGGAGGGLMNGEILSKDAQSITLKLRDGGSKIIFFSTSTEISKFVAGAAGDLEAGKTVMVSGQANQDGSVAAQTIQIRQDAAPTPAPKQ